MTDRLTPPMLRDLAHALVASDDRKHPLTDAGKMLYRISHTLEEEAARREARARPVTMRDILDAACKRPAPQGEREGPDSAAAPAHWKGSTLDPDCKPEDKPAPAADDLHRAIDKLSDAVARFRNSMNGQSQTDYKAQADALNARDEIKALFEAQAREIAKLKATAADRHESWRILHAILGPRHWPTGGNNAALTERVRQIVEAAEARVRELEAALITTASNALAAKARADRLAAALLWSMDEIDELANVACGFAYPQAMSVMGRTAQSDNYTAAVMARREGGNRG